MQKGSRGKKDQIKHYKLQLTWNELIINNTKSISMSSFSILGGKDQKSVAT